MEQTIGILDLPVFQLLVKMKPFSKWKKKKKKTFLPATRKVAVSSINNLITNGFNPAYGGLCALKIKSCRGGKSLLGCGGNVLLLDGVSAPRVPEPCLAQG